MRGHVIIGPALLAMAFAGCTGGEVYDAPDAGDGTDPQPRGLCGLDFLDSPAEPLSEPELAEVPESEADLVVDVSSSTRKPLRVTIRVNGEVALDVRTPAVPPECSHSPVYSHGFRVPSDSARVTASTDQGQRRSITVSLDGSTHWVAVQPQDDLPIGLDAFDEEPAWG